MSALKGKIILLFTTLAGSVVPFVPELAMTEVFLLLIPFLIVFAVTAIFLVVSLLHKGLNKKKALFSFLILPVFILSQFASTFIVGRFQRIRSNFIIEEIHKIKLETEHLPEHHDLFLGIEYRKKDENTFEISYSSGFLVTEKYSSDKGKWIRCGWND